jgi:hypothetical protein
MKVLPRTPAELFSPSIVFVHDPTDSHVIPVGKQTLNPSHIWYRPCSGIWQSVFIESVPKDYVTDLHITGDASGQVNLTVNTSAKKPSVVEITVSEKVSITCCANVFGGDLLMTCEGK